jgi:hypothetical protein
MPEIFYKKLSKIALLFKWVMKFIWRLLRNFYDLNKENMSRKARIILVGRDLASVGPGGLD